MAQWPLEREPLPSCAILQRTARRQSCNQRRSITRHDQITITFRSSKRGRPRILTDKCEAMISGFHAFPGEAEPSVLAKVNGSVRQYFSPVRTRRSAGPRIQNSILDWNRVPSKDQRLSGHERSPQKRRPPSFVSQSQALLCQHQVNVTQIDISISDRRET